LSRRGRTDISGSFVAMSLRACEEKRVVLLVLVGRECRYKEIGFPAYGFPVASVPEHLKQ